MSRPYTLSGIELPEPIRREVHHYSNRGARDEHIDIKMIEVEHKNTLTFITDNRSEDGLFDWVATEYMLAAVMYCIECGWTLVSMSATTAFLKRC